MVFFKIIRKPRLSLKERLIKNKQYLQRRLLRISKRAYWLKRKTSKRLKQLNKSRRIHGYYRASFNAKTTVKIIKIKKITAKVYNKSKNKLLQTKKHTIKIFAKFNIVNVGNKIIGTHKHKSLFKYFA